MMSRLEAVIAGVFVVGAFAIVAVSECVARCLGLFEATHPAPPPRRLAEIIDLAERRRKRRRRAA